MPKNLPGAHLHLVGSSFESSASSEKGYTSLKKEWCDSFEKQFLVTTLNRNGGNVSAAAREAKLDRSNFLRLLRRHGLKAQEYRKAA
jgi:transcriptional regulator of acetoin/glycerol metabolism